MSTSTLPQPGTIEIEDDQLNRKEDENTIEIEDDQLNREEDEQKNKEKAQIDGYITECRSIYQHRLVSGKTREEYEDMWQGMRERGEIKYMSENSRFLYKMISEAENYERTFKLQLDEATKQKWIGKRTQGNWMKRFNDPAVVEHERKKWIEEEFPKYLAGWQETASVRKDVWKLVKELKVDEKDIPELKDVLKVQDFLSLHFLERQNKIYTAKAALIAYKEMEQVFLSSIERQLKTAITNGYMHPHKIGKWLARVMESKKPHSYATDVLGPCMKRWEAVKGRYNAVMPDLKQEPGKMRGFKQISDKGFLLLDYDARIAFVEEAESRLASDVNEEGPLAALRLDIRHAMDTGDWEEAESLLSDAQKLDSDDKAVRSMARYLETHRTDKNKKQAEQIDEQVEKKNKGMEALTNLRDIMGKLPTNMRAMTEKALNSSNPNTLKRLWQCFYNRHWVIVNGYSTPPKDKEEGEKEINHLETENSIPNGNGSGFIRRTIKGDTATDAAIRDDCEDPQVLYTNGSGLTEVYEGIERNADNPKFGYWTTLVDDDVPYELLREAVMNHMYHIKKNAKDMREAGLMYSSNGTPF